MPTLEASGTTTTDGTEQTLTTLTNNKVFVFVIDTNAMINSDIIEIRLKTKVLSGGTSRIAWVRTYAHIQGEPNKYSVPVPANIELIATLKRVGGTDRAYPWAVLSL